MDLWLRNYFQHNPDPARASHFYNATKSYVDIPIESQTEFWLNYCQTVADGGNPYLCEVVGNREAIQLGFNIKFSFERARVSSQNNVIIELIDSIDNYVRHIIGVTQVTMNTYFEVSHQGTEFLACYLRRDKNAILVWNNNTVEFVARIIFPYARIRIEYLSKFYHYILNQLQVNGDNPDKFLTLSPINGFDTLLQPITGPILEMYGSTQNEDIPPLKLYEIYGLLNSPVVTTFQLSKVFIPNFHTAVQHGIVNPMIIAQKIQERGFEFWLPLFFSIGYYDVPLKAKDGLSLANEMPTVTLEIIMEGGESFPKLERARQLLNLISHSRVEEYWSWYDIGQALHSVDSGVEGLRLWKWITSQSDFKTEQDCEMVWPTIENNNEVDIETLEYFASIDNPEKYNTFREPEVNEALVKAIHFPVETPVAKAFKACFPHQFICANFAEGEWYYYSQHRWVPMSGTSELMWYINEKFQPILERKQSEIADRIAKSRDADAKSKNQAFMTLIGQLILKLSKNGFKKSLCEELKIYYRKENFDRLKDTNPHYMSTPSGVIDLRGGVPSVRPGKPQDYITKQTRYAYPHNFTWEHPAVQMTMNYLRQVFRSQTLLNYILRFGASLLRSGNNDKIFPIFSGEGNNSKSIFVRIIECAFGNYAVKLPTSLITDKRTSADSATPTLVHSKGAKVAFLQEPNARDVIQSGTVKEITGGVDTLYVRDLFQKGSKIVEMDVTIVPILIANKIPVIPDCQEAIWNRTRVIYFDSKWSANAPQDPEEQFRTGVFKMDKFFDRNIPVMAPALLWIFVQKFEEYITEGLNDPPEVLQATENFRVANNFYIHFTRDCIKPVLTPTGEIDRTAFVTLDELFNAFRKWYKDQEFRVKQPNKTEFKENLQIVWKQKADSENKWYGIRLNTQASTIANILMF